MLNYIWLCLLVFAVMIAGFRDRMPQTVEGAVKSAETAVTLSLGLIGIMALWLGMMRLAEKSGVVRALARLLRPLLTRLFPDVPGDHPAMGSMVMNVAANMLGLNNAATPLGLRAMRDLETLNPRPGTATNAMCTFLAINTSSVQLIPLTAVAVLASAGSSKPTAIIGTALIATVFSTGAAIIAVKALEKLPIFRLKDSPGVGRTARPVEPVPDERESVVEVVRIKPLRWWGWLILAAVLGSFVWFMFSLSFPHWFGRPAKTADASAWVNVINAISLLAVPFLLAIFPLYASLRGIDVYEQFVEGAKEGFQVAVRIIPFLVAMLVAIGMFRGAGGIDMLTDLLRPALELVHFPPELVPMSLIRSLSGSGSLAVLTDIVTQYGPDHILARMAGTIFGSTETTFYVVAVYFGSVSVQRTRHAVPAGLIADLVGVVASVVICRMVFGGQ